MKCVELVSARSNSIPIAECGGVVLADGDKLIVKEEIASRMLLQYVGYLVKVGEVEKEQLAGGHYEYAHKRSGNLDVSLAIDPSDVSVPTEIRVDKSFIGKAKRKIKGF